MKIGFLLAILFFCFFLLVVVKQIWSTRINKQNYEKIILGVSQTEVEELLGEPPGKYFPEICDSFLPGRPETWRSGDIYITVFFDDDDRVIYKRFFKISLRDINPIERILYELQSLKNSQ